MTLTREFVFGHGHGITLVKGGLNYAEPVSCDEETQAWSCVEPCAAEDFWITLFICRMTLEGVLAVEIIGRQWY